MTQRVLGPTGSKRRRRFQIVPILLVAAAALLLVGSAQAVHDEAFQLDGDVSASTTTTYNNVTQNFDWDSFFNAAGQKSPVLPDATRPGFTASGFDQDFGTTTKGGQTVFDTSDATTYTQGSKDTLNISSNWVCTPANNVTNKGDILNAYSVAYTDPAIDPLTGQHDQFLYFALERSTNTGDANVAFWFLQDPTVGCPQGGGTSPWTGNHTDGDILLVSAFTKGGVVSTINAYRWNGGANGSLGTTPVASGGDCTATNPPAPLGDTACATANKVGISVPWLTFDATDGLDHHLQTAEFFEGGINLTKSNLGGKCFNVFVGDTRSSQSLTATLFDFARGALGECTSTTATQPVDATDTSQPPASSIPAAPAAAKVTVKDKTTVTVTGISSFSGSISWHICGPTATSSTQLCDGTTGNVGVDLGSQSITAGGTYNSPTATVTAAGRYCFRADFSGDSTAGVPPSHDNSAGECFTVGPLTPTISTQAGAGPVDFGNPVTDTASLSGTANEPGTGGPAGDSGSINPGTLGGPAGGTITFKLFKSDCTTLATGTGTNPQTVPVSGNGTYGPVSFTPDAPGTYYWNATYSGDPPNTNASPASNSPCPDASEAVVVRQIPTSLKTKQDWIPNDTAAVSSTSGNLGANGTVRFRLYASSNCSGSALYDETVAVSGGVPSQEVHTNNTGSGAGMLKITTGYNDPAGSTAGPYSWLVEYAPNASDTAHLGSSSSCNAENFSTTYTNDPGTP